MTYGFSENNIHYNVYNGEPKEITDSNAISLMKVQFVCLVDGVYCVSLCVINC